MKKKIKPFSVARMDDEKLVQTRAFYFYSQNEFPPNQRFMNLIAHAQDVTLHSGLVPRDYEGHRRHPVSVEHEWQQNIELHASIECARRLLEDKAPGNLVQPKMKLEHCQDFSPLKYAKALKNHRRPADSHARGPYHNLGKFFEDMLKDHQSLLDFKENGTAAGPVTIPLPTKRVTEEEVDDLYKDGKPSNYSDRLRIS